MKRSFLCCPGFFLFTLAFLPPSLSAAVVERDWKTPSDGLLTLDTVNKLEWLDLSQTLLSDQFPGTGSDFLEIREARYQYVVGQTAPGGMFDEFTVAKSADVLALAQSAGVDTSPFPLYELNIGPMLTIGNLLGFTFTIDSEFAGLMETSGLLDETGSVPFNHRVGVKFHIRIPSEARVFFGSSHTQDIQFPPGVMLYRTIPEPGSLILVIIFVITINSFGGSNIHRVLF